MLHALGAALAAALVATPPAPVARVEAGPLLYELHVSRTAQLFYLVDELSAWSPFCHRQYARWAQTQLPPDESEEKLLARHRELRRKHGFGQGLEQAFLTPLGLDEAAAAAVAAHALTPEEVREELAVLQHFGPRLQPFIDAEAPRLEAFRQRAAQELPQKAEFLVQLAHFVELSGTQTVPVYLMPDPSPDVSGGSFNGGVLAVEVPSRADPLPTLVHESFHALLSSRRQELQRAVTDTPGLDWETLSEGLAYALMPGILHDGPAQSDALAQQVVEHRKADKPWSDPSTRFYAFGLYLRDALKEALAQGTTLAAFLPVATERFRELAPPGVQRGLALSPLEVRWLGNAGWQLTNGKRVVLVDPYLSRRPATGKPSANSAEWELRVADAPPPYGDEVLVPDARAIDAHVQGADLILVTHAHADHLLDVPVIAKKTGAVVLGTESVINVVRAAGVRPNQLVAVHAGEDLALDGLSVRVLASLHSRLARGYFDSRTIPRGARYPLRAKDYVEGGVLAYLLRIDGHQIYVNGTMNFVESELDGLRPDIAIVGAADNRRSVHAYTTRLMRALGYPRLVLPSHVDAETLPIAEARMEDRLARTFREFSEEVKAISPESQVMTPQYFEPIQVGRDFSAAPDAGVP